MGKDFLTYITEAKYWQRIELIGTMLSFVTVIFALRLSDFLTGE